jgi:hypothetical protein
VVLELVLGELVVEDIVADDHNSVLRKVNFQAGDRLLRLKLDRANNIKRGHRNQKEKRSPGPLPNAPNLPAGNHKHPEASMVLDTPNLAFANLPALQKLPPGGRHQRQPAIEGAQD